MPPVNAQGPLTGALQPPPFSALLTPGPSPDSCLLCSQGDRGSEGPAGCLGRLPCSYRGWIRRREGIGGGGSGKRGVGVCDVRGGNRWGGGKAGGKAEWKAVGRGGRGSAEPRRTEWQAGRGSLLSPRGLCALLTCLRSWDGSFPRSVGPGSLGRRGRRRCPACSHRCPH